MTLYPGDLAYMTPDADGTVKLNRGTTAQNVIPFPSFVGDTKFYSGPAADVGKGDLLGWELVAQITAGTMVRLAIADAEVGVIAGTNTYTPALTPDQTLAPTGTVDAAHDHGGEVDDPDDTMSVVEGALTTKHPASDTHHHPIAADLSSPLDLAMDPIDLNPVTIDPITITPKAIALYLIRFTGVIANATT